MKTNLLKMALCAVVAALPLGAWAHEIVQVSQVKMTWLFDQFVHNGTVLQNPAEKSASLCLDGLWIAVQSNSTVGARKYAAARENVTAITKSSKCTDDDVMASGFTIGNYMGMTSNTIGTLRFNRSPSQVDGYGAWGMRFNTSGTIYALVKGTYNNSQTRTVALYDCTSREGHTEATKEDEVTPTSNYASEWYLIKAIVPDGGGIYQIMSTVGGSCTVLGITFIPTTEAAGKHQNVVTLNDGIATYSASYPCDVPTGCKAYIASSVEDGKIKLTQITEIPANTGVILKADNIETASVTLKSKLVSDYVLPATNKLMANIGAYQLPKVGKDKSTTDFTNYILVKQSGNIVFAPTSGTGNLAANKAFLHLKSSEIPASSRDMTIDFERSTTAINNINLNETVDNRFFNLNGQRVKCPVKGLYIINGMKVVVK